MRKGKQNNPRRAAARARAASRTSGARTQSVRIAACVWRKALQGGKSAIGKGSNFKDN